MRSWCGAVMALWFVIGKVGGTAFTAWSWWWLLLPIVPVGDLLARAMGAGQ